MAESTGKLPAWLTGEDETAAPQPVAESTPAPEAAAQQPVPETVAPQPVPETAPASETAAPQPAPETSAPQPISSPSAEDPAMTAAYLAKLQELKTVYGSVHMYQSQMDTSYLTGLCGLSFLDLDGNGVTDMLTVLWNGTLSGKGSADGIHTTSADYRVDVWTWQNGEVTSLFAIPYAGSYENFSTEFWDNSICLMTAVRKADGRTVLRFLQDSLTRGSFTLAEIYCQNGAFYQDTFSFTNGTYLRNGNEITADEWQEALKAEAILYSGVFSDDEMENGFGLTWEERTNYEAYHSLRGRDLIGTILRNQELESALEKGVLSPCEARNEWIPEYLYALDFLQRENHLLYENTSQQIHNYEYSLYDLDANGTPELIVKEYASEASAFYDVYTVANGQLIYCGQDSGAHSVLSVNGGAGIAALNAHMGYYNYRYWTLENNLLQVNYSEEKSGFADDYNNILDTDYPFDLGNADPADPTLLYRYALTGSTLLSDAQRVKWNSMQSSLLTDLTALLNPEPEETVIGCITVVNGIQAPVTDFIFPYSSERELLWAELDVVLWRDDETERHDISQLAINEIFARYGFTFGTGSSSSRLAYDTFEACGWYQEAKAACPDDNWNNLYYYYLNDTERTNVELINAWQQQNGVYY